MTSSHIKGLFVELSSLLVHYAADGNRYKGHIFELNAEKYT